MRRLSGLISAVFCVLSAAALCWGLTAAAGAAPAPAGVVPEAVATPPPPPPAGPASPAWGHAQQAPGITTLDHSGGGALEAIACPAQGACTAGGFYSDGVSKKQQGFVIGETSGLWGPAEDVPLVPQLNTGGSADVLTVACLAAGECGAGGFYRDATGLEGFIGSEVSDTWDGSIELPGSGGNAQIDAEACPAFGRCVVGGYIADTHGNRQPFVEQSNAWPTAAPVPDNLNKGSLGEVTSLSCTSLGSCVAGGFYTDAKGGRQAFVVTQAATSDSCGPVGDYTTMTGSQQPFVVSGSVDAPSLTAMTLSAASAVYGHEQAERVAANVHDVFGSVPTGTVSINAGKTVACTITLKAGTGSCTVPATKFGPGTVSVTAFYGGGISFGTSQSVAKNFTVKKATTKTALALSTSSITVGKEQAERLSVAVIPQLGGTPAGTVTLKAGTRTVCTVALKSGKGSCALSAKELTSGTYHLIASYPGKGGFTASASAPRTLKVTR
jgi:hypothetical protein